MKGRTYAGIIEENVTCGRNVSYLIYSCKLSARCIILSKKSKAFPGIDSLPPSFRPEGLKDNLNESGLYQHRSMSF